MNIDLTRLNNNIDSKIDVNFDYDFKNNELDGTELLNCNITVYGSIYKNSLNEVVLDLNIDGKMILPCAITLKPTDYPFNIIINGPISEKLDENERNFTNTLDIFPIIWENILMEIPMRVVSDEAKDIKLSGDGWTLITDEDTTSSPFAELEDLLK